MMVSVVMTTMSVVMTTMSVVWLVGHWVPAAVIR